MERDKQINFCYHNNVVFTHLFDEKRYTKTTETSDSKYLFTWSYYECPTCNQILVYRKPERSFVELRVSHNRDGKGGSTHTCEHEVTDFDVLVDGVVVYDSLRPTITEEEK